MQECRENVTEYIKKPIKSRKKIIALLSQDGRLMAL